MKKNIIRLLKSKKNYYPINNNEKSLKNKEEELNLEINKLKEEIKNKILEINTKEEEIKMITKKQNDLNKEDNEKIQQLISEKEKYINEI